MSLRYKGAVISATPPTTTGGNSGTAPGSWTLQQQLQAQAGGVWPSQPVWYIEDVFSTYLYTGNGSTQTITNGIDLAGKGGLVWTKDRGVANHFLYDTARGTNVALLSNATNANLSLPSTLTSFDATGFSLGSGVQTNTSGNNYVSWTFRKQPKFFDVVTYTGNGTTNNIAHALASVPGCLIVKKTSTTGNWIVITRDASGNYVYGYLNTTGSMPSAWSAASTSTYMTSTTLNMNSIASITAEDLNASGVSYVAYLFAHNAGGFGLTGTDNVISCGSFTTDGSGNATVSLGYEPGWVLYKRSDSSTGGNWNIVDNMRGFTANTSSNDNLLFANLSDAETNSTGIFPTATGFQIASGGFASRTYIYIAIRRGPMKTPTTGTSVFAPKTYSPSGFAYSITGNSFPPDVAFIRDRSDQSNLPFTLYDRLRGPYASLNTTSTGGEDTIGSTGLSSFNQDGYSLTGGAYQVGYTGYSYVVEMLRRAPGFLDVVCFTSSGSGTTQNHNLTVAPELIIVKPRNYSPGNWFVYCAALSSPLNKYTFVQSTNSTTDAGTPIWQNITSSTFGFTSYFDYGVSQVAYLFASCPGVSKVGSYTGTGAAQTINCGFTAGARFILIKRTDSAGAWYVYDTARGITAGNDPYLLMNATGLETTNTDYISPQAVGFGLTASAPADLNAPGGSYIFLAIA